MDEEGEEVEEEEDDEEVDEEERWSTKATMTPAPVNSPRGVRRGRAPDAPDAGAADPEPPWAPDVWGRWMHPPQEAPRIHFRGFIVRRGF